MYSVVLMMALTTGGDATAFGHRHSCCGGDSYSCCGGYSYGYASYSCCGGYSSYSGYSCCGGYESSCCGGERHGLFGRHRHNSCCGGSYASYSCCGGSYASYSCCGGYDYSSYCGCNTASYSCCGGYMAAPSYGTPVIQQPGTPAVGEPIPTKTAPEEIKTKPTDKPKEESAVPAPATIIVSVPADAKLTIDDAATVSTAATRVFTSPVLPAGQDFHYTLKAEYSRDGRPVVVSKDVTVRAGIETRVNLNGGLVGVASR